MMIFNIIQIKSDLLYWPEHTCVHMYKNGNLWLNKNNKWNWNIYIIEKVAYYTLF